MTLNSILKKSINSRNGYFKKNLILYILILPGIMYYIIFHYVPMFGIIIAFKNYQPFMGLEGIFSSEWVGLNHFIRFFNSIFSFQLISNTFLISLYKIIWGFPAPIILALMLNEINARSFKRTIQTISYLPHFLSMVIVCGMVRALTTTSGGLINIIVSAFGGEPIFFLGQSKYFRTILVIADIWKEIGWGSIVYLAAMSNIDVQLYDAATVDGANWLRRIIHITLPGIMPVISILLIFRMGKLMNAGFEQIFLLYSPMVYDVGDVISTYVYREGIVSMKYSYGTAVNLFTSVISLFFILMTNFVIKKMGQEGIW